MCGVVWEIHTDSGAVTNFPLASTAGSHTGGGKLLLKREITPASAIVHMLHRARSAQDHRATTQIDLISLPRTLSREMKGENLKNFKSFFE